MRNEDLLSRIRTRQSADLRARFPQLSERDIMQIIGAPHHAVHVLQRCFGGDVEEAKAAWNDFVLRYLDGGQHAAPRKHGAAALGDEPVA
jgi:hypothetical protein